MRKSRAVAGLHITGIAGVLMAFWLAAVVEGAPAQAQGGRSAPSALDKECEYGIFLALDGRHAAAESVFVSLLTHAPGDPRAFTNLGNLNLLRGDLDVALVFYARAAKADSADPGISLNQATALMLRGDQEEAQARAREAIVLAGGARNATRLLGLPDSGIDEDAPKEASRSYVTRDEVLALLKAAVGNIPGDTARADSSTARPDDPKTRKRSPAWRSAGARAAADTEAAAVVYWKR